MEIEVPSFAPLYPWLALTGHSHTRAILDACRNADFNCLEVHHHAGPLTGIAGPPTLIPTSLAGLAWLRFTQIHTFRDTGQDLA